MLNIRNSSDNSERPDLNQVQTMHDTLYSYSDTHNNHYTHCTTTIPSFPTSTSHFSSENFIFESVLSVTSNMFVEWYKS